jgi:hypothetical protein
MGFCVMTDNGCIENHRVTADGVLRSLDKDTTIAEMNDGSIRIYNEETGALEQPPGPSVEVQVGELIYERGYVTWDGTEGLLFVTDREIIIEGTDIATRVLRIPGTPVNPDILDEPGHFIYGQVQLDGDGALMVVDPPPSQGGGGGY